MRVKPAYLPLSIFLLLDTLTSAVTAVATSMVPVTLVEVLPLIFILNIAVSGTVTVTFAKPARYVPSAA